MVPVPAPLSPAERAAAGFAVAYLRQGAPAWQRLLASDSPWRPLPAAEAVAEIAARVGPAAGAHWQLQRPAPDRAPAVVFAVEYPSGMTETLWLELVSERGKWRLRSLRTLSEPWPLPKGTAPEIERIAALPPGPPGPSPGLVALAITSAMVVLGLAAALPARRRRAALTSFLLAGAALACRHPIHHQAPAVATSGPPALGALVPLRLAMARGIGGAALQRVLTVAPHSGVAGEVVRLWRADGMLREFRLNEAAKLLASLDEPSPFPLAELLQARLEALRGAPKQALQHYERVRAAGADDDGLRLEAAIALATGGEDEVADHAFARLRGIGSRLAIPYYVGAESALADDHGEEAESLFRRGWELQPLSRQRLFGSPLLASVCTRQAVFPLLQFGSAAEPKVGGAVPGSSALELPVGEARLSGELLRIAIGDAELRIPGGAVLAPAATTLESPAVFERRERDAEVAELATLERQASVPGAFAQPALRRRLELAATGLAEQSRWGDVLALTERLPSYAGRLPPDLTQLRAAALMESAKSREAFDLLVRLAQDDKVHGRRDAGTLYQLAEALSREGRLDLAIKVVHRANLISGLAAGEARERQLHLEQELVESHEQLETRYFRIRYPHLADARYAQQLAVVLDEERKRLAYWIPVENLQPVDVDLYPLEEFLKSYSAEMPVVGVFDGRVRVPFADLHSLHPQLVAILSHELAHALITQATGDRAPKWVQEGLAQHVQMLQESANPFPDLANAGHELSLAVVEQSLGGFSEPQFVELSYAEAAWAFHYLEARHGVAAIHRLLAAFANGDDGEGALHAALGMDTAGLDEALRGWATREAPKVWPSHVRRYDEEAYLAELQRPAEKAPVEASANGDLFLARRRMAAAMASWHAAYRQWARPVKVAYAPVLAALRGGGGLGPAEAADCRRLAEAAANAVASPARFQAPDERLARPLLDAFTSLRDTGFACARGDRAAARAQVETTQRLLAEAAAVLAAYDLRP